MSSGQVLGMKSDYRVRRAKDKSGFLAELVESGAFPAMRDAIGFAAALGWSLNKREKIEASDEPIAWATFTNKPLQEQLVEMIAAATVDDPEILSDERLADRIQLIEEFANAGLSALQQMTGSTLLLDALTKLILDQEHGDTDLEPWIDQLSTMAT